MNMQSNEFLFILYRNPLHKPTHRATPISLRSEAMALAVAALVLLTLLSRKETQDNVRAKGGRTFFLLCAVGWPPIGLAPPLFPFLCPFVLRGLTVLEDFNFHSIFFLFIPKKHRWSWNASWGWPSHQMRRSPAIPIREPSPILRGM